MKEFFIYANSFAAPFFSDTSTSYVKAETPEAALLSFVASYKHPCGLFAALCYASADGYHAGPSSVLICRECNCVGPEATNVDQAFARWNKRAAPPIAYVDVEVEAS